MSSPKGLFDADRRYIDVYSYLSNETAKERIVSRLASRLGQRLIDREPSQTCRVSGSSFRGGNPRALSERKSASVAGFVRTIRKNDRAIHSRFSIRSASRG